MKDPIMEKLKTDARIVLVDLWRILRHQPAVEDEWLDPRLPQTEEKEVGPDRSPEASRSGLCYFHLN